MSDQFNKSLLIEYWINSSEKDFKTMNDLFNTKNNHWALFMGHLVINARYDDYKNSFYKLCTDDFTKEWITKTKECRLWIKTML
jgi:hypothetical protein